MTSYCPDVANCVAIAAVLRGSIATAQGNFPWMLLSCALFRAKARAANALVGNLSGAPWVILLVIEPLPPKHLASDLYPQT